MSYSHRPWRPGLLVIEKYWTSDHSLAFPNNEEVGVVLRCWDSNVYEGASADVLIDGQERNILVKNLIRVEDMERRKK